MSILKKILNVVKIVMIVFLIIFIICFGSIVYQKKVLKSSMPNLFGYAGGTIVSGSMQPNIMIGDYVIVSVNGGYDVGDVVMFKRGNSYIAHRVIEVFDDGVITKGDANETEDTKISKDEVVGPVVKVVKGFGNFLTFLSKYKYLIFVIIVAIVILL